MRRINNKTKKALSLDSFEKHPGKFLKKDTSSRIRRQAKDEIENYDPLLIRTPSANDKHALRKRSGHCPFCVLRLRRNKRETRYVNSCEHCKAQLKPDIHCNSCNSNRVWGREDKYRCKGCGKNVER